MTTAQKAPPGGGRTGRGLMSDSTARVSLIDVTRRTPSRSLKTLVHHLDDAPRARLDQHGLAVHDGVAIGGGAETLRHVIIGHAARSEERRVGKEGRCR